MKVYPCGYSIHSAQIMALMGADPALLLIDLRKNSDSSMATWKARKSGHSWPLLGGPNKQEKTPRASS